MLNLCVCVCVHFKDLFLISVYTCLCLCEYIVDMQMRNRGQKRLSDPLELELEAVVNIRREEASLVLAFCLR